MKRRTGHPPDWVPLDRAAGRTGLHETALRAWIRKKVFTGLRRTPSKNSALFVPEAEVAAFERGGIDAVIALRSGSPVAAGA